MCLQEFRGREKAQLTLWDFWGLEQPTGDLGCCGRQSTQSFSYGRNIMWLASIPQSHWATHSWCVGSPAACALGGPWILHIWRELLLYLKELRDTLLLQASKWSKEKVHPGTGLENTKNVVIRKQWQTPPNSHIHSATLEPVQLSAKSQKRGYKSVLQCSYFRGKQRWRGLQRVSWITITIKEGKLQAVALGSWVPAFYPSQQTTS